MKHNSRPNIGLERKTAVIVKVNNLVKRYGDLTAVDHFSLEVNDGEVFGLLGPNGSGKTTTINCILSLLEYDQGEIEIFGQPMTPESYNIILYCLQQRIQGSK
jgi:ABC-2 type transport system ATP-binding protein